LGGHSKQGQEANVLFCRLLLCLLRLFCILPIRLCLEALPLLSLLLLAATAARHGPVEVAVSLPLAI
jgi:hypothetical protein